MCRSIIVATTTTCRSRSICRRGWSARPRFAGRRIRSRRAAWRRSSRARTSGLGRTVILKAPREGDDLPRGHGRDVPAARDGRGADPREAAAPVDRDDLRARQVDASAGRSACSRRSTATSLRDRLDELAELETRDGKPRTRERLELLSNLVSIAEALAYAHEQRVVHRDCTPNNIILGKRGEATLIDWGIARDLDAPGDGDAAQLDDESPSRAGGMVTISAGTPPYLPLEQSQGRSADPSFDVYSFGITLYEVVSGQDAVRVEARRRAGRAAQLDAVPRRGSRRTIRCRRRCRRIPSCPESSRGRWRAIPSTGSPPTSSCARSSST